MNGMEFSETIGMDSLMKYQRDRNKQGYKLEWENLGFI